MAPHSSTLAWKIPWTEEPGGLQSMGSHRVGHDWATSLSLFTFMHWRRQWQPTPVFLPGESQGRQSLVGCHLWGRRVGHNWSDLAAAASHPVWRPGEQPNHYHHHLQHRQLQNRSHQLATLLILPSASLSPCLLCENRGFAGVKLTSLVKPRKCKPGTAQLHASPFKTKQKTLQLCSQALHKTALRLT